MLRVTSHGEVTEQTQHRRRRWGSNCISKSLTPSVQAEMGGGGGLLRTLPLLSALLTATFTESAREQSPGLLWVLRAQLCTVGALPQVTQRCWGSGRGVNLSHLVGLFQPRGPNSETHAQELGDSSYFPDCSHPPPTPPPARQSP